MRDQSDALQRSILRLECESGTMSSHLDRFFIFPLTICLLHYFWPIPADNQVTWRHYIFSHMLYSWYWDFAVPFINAHFYDQSILADICILLILFMLMTCWYWICYAIIVVFEPDRYLTTFIMSSKENHQYNILYKKLNGPPPPNVYALNFRYNNIYDCGICMDEFCILSHGNETLLHCGHRYHSSCLRQWELQQFYDYPYLNYHCPVCKREYDWTQKYHYIYTIQHCKYPIST